MSRTSLVLTPGGIDVAVELALSDLPEPAAVGVHGVKTARGDEGDGVAVAPGRIHQIEAPALVVGPNGAGGSTVSTYEPVNLCVNKGDYVDFNDEGGSGFHVHVSVNDESGQTVFGDPGGADGLSAVGR